MLGALITLVFSAAIAGFGRFLLKRWISVLDPALQWGFGGLVGLGTVGTLTLLVGLLPSGLQLATVEVAGCAIIGLLSFFKPEGRPRFQIPRDSRLVAVGFLTLATLFALAGVLAPSDTIDWDSLAYHLAVPKMWLEAGQIQFVSYIHHSNFPFAVDNLYLWGLAWGGESGAKAFSIAFLVFGMMSIFGLARGRYGEKAAWWAASAFAAIPMVLWLSGTAYIDVANGLYAGLGIAFAALWIQGTVNATTQPPQSPQSPSSPSSPQSPHSLLVLAGIAIGLCAGSKYTGLQILISAALMLVLVGIFKKNAAIHFKSAATIALIAVAIACPWYIKNVVNTGNPVYPFFYSVFGGKNWDGFSEKIYKEQQQTFGVGRPMEPDYLSNPIQPQRLGAAILGLAYQPGRYIDPAPTQNGGFPFGALGFVSIAAALLWLTSGKLEPFESGILITIGLALGMWFFLSEQSRYILGLTVPLCILGGGAVAKLKSGIALAVGITIQALAALYLIKVGRLDTQLPVLTGKVTPEEYQTQLVRFYEPSQWINANVKGKIALYDEVFGYFLDIPYFWAGPGHTTEIGYDHLQDGEQLAKRLKELGLTHVYIDLSTTFGGDRASRDRWLDAAGITSNPSLGYTAEEIAAASTDIRNKYKILLAQAIASHRLNLIQSFGTRRIFSIP